jgi:ABC-type sugar transport system permease subunit
MKADVGVSGGYQAPRGYRSGGIGRMVLKTLRKPQFQFGAITLIPILIWYAIFIFWSVIQAFHLSLIYYRIVDPSRSRFLGLDNFRALFNDPLFPTALKNSFAWGILGIVIGIPLALAISLCLVNVRRGRTLYQTVIFIPVVLSLISVVLLIKIVFDPEIGPVNQVLSALHLPTSKWLNSSETALPTSVVVGIWKGIGVTIVILTAGLLNIPTELNDAARVDGAGPFGRFWHVTMPLLQPTLNLILILGVINGLQEFTLPQTLTQGGPSNATYLLNIYIYNLAFATLQFGQAAAAAIVEFAITLGLTLITLRLTRVNWSY